MSGNRAPASNAMILDDSVERSSWAERYRQREALLNDVQDGSKLIDAEYGLNHLMKTFETIDSPLTGRFQARHLMLP